MIFVIAFAEEKLIRLESLRFAAKERVCVTQAEVVFGSEFVGEARVLEQYGAIAFDDGAAGHRDHDEAGAITLNGAAQCVQACAISTRVNTSHAFPLDLARAILDLRLRFFGAHIAFVSRLHPTVRAQLQVRDEVSDAQLLARTFPELVPVALLRV